MHITHDKQKSDILEKLSQVANHTQIYIDLNIKSYILYLQHCKIQPYPKSQIPSQQINKRTENVTNCHESLLH